MLITFFHIILAVGNFHVVASSPLGEDASRVPTISPAGPVMAQSTVLPNVPATQALPAYDPQCNWSNELFVNDLWGCFNYLRTNRSTSLCEVNGSAQFCQWGALKVSGVSYRGGYTSALCPDVADAMSGIWEKCHTDQSDGSVKFFGGSRSTIDNENLIVHIQPYWVTPV